MESTVVIRTNSYVPVRHRVDAQPQGHQVVVHVAGAEVAVARSLVLLFAGERVKPHVLSAVFPFRFMCRLVQISCRFYMVVYLLEQICPLYHYDEK